MVTDKIHYINFRFFAPLCYAQNDNGLSYRGGGFRPHRKPTPTRHSNHITNCHSESLPQRKNWGMMR
jgi:hypothetical protein